MSGAAVAGIAAAIMAGVVAIAAVALLATDETPASNSSAVENSRPATTAASPKAAEELATFVRLLKSEFSYRGDTYHEIIDYNVAQHRNTLLEHLDKTRHLAWDTRMDEVFKKIVDYCQIEFWIVGEAKVEALRAWRRSFETLDDLPAAERDNTWYAENPQEFGVPPDYDLRVLPFWFAETADNSAWTPIARRKLNQVRNSKQARDDAVRRMIEKRVGTPEDLKKLEKR